MFSFKSKFTKVSSVLVFYHRRSTKIKEVSNLVPGSAFAESCSTCVYNETTSLVSKEQMLLSYRKRSKADSGLQTEYSSEVSWFDTTRHLETTRLDESKLHLATDFERENNSILRYRMTQMLPKGITFDWQTESFPVHQECSL